MCSARLPKMHACPDGGFSIFHGPRWLVRRRPVRRAAPPSQASHRARRLRRDRGHHQAAESCVTRTGQLRTCATEDSQGESHVRSRSARTDLADGTT